MWWHGKFSSSQDISWLSLMLDLVMSLSLCSVYVNTFAAWRTGHDGSGVTSWRRSHIIRIADESSLSLSIRLSKAPWAGDLVLIEHSLLLEISLYTFSICLSCSRFRCQSDGTVLSFKVFSNWSQYDVVGVESLEKKSSNGFHTWVGNISDLQIKMQVFSISSSVMIGVPCKCLL